MTVCWFGRLSYLKLGLSSYLLRFATYMPSRKLPTCCLWSEAFFPCTNPQNILVLALNKHLLHSSQLIINFDWHGCRFSCSVLIRSKDKTHPLLMERARVILSVARAYWARTLFMKPSGHIINIPPISLLLWNSHSRGQWPYCSLSIAWIRNQWCMTAPNGSMRAISIFLCLSK